MKDFTSTAMREEGLEMYSEYISFDPISLFTEREAYEFFGVCSDIGGIIEVFYVLAGLIVSPFAALSFKQKAI